MKVMAVNGSPRKHGNTATLLKNAIRGAVSVGAETEMVNLYDIDFKGCTSCFACKLKDGPSYGRCAWNDGLSPVLDRARDVDVIIFGSPIFFWDVSGEMRSFMERLLFPFIVYDKEQSTTLTKNIRSGWIFTMNVTEGTAEGNGLLELLKDEIQLTRRILGGSSDYLLSTDTFQFSDYSKYVSSRWDPEEKAKRLREVFPKDCTKAFEMGARLAQG
jgi:multimeric flavodoxin WrbA